MPCVHVGGHDFIEIHFIFQFIFRVFGRVFPFLFCAMLSTSNAGPTALWSEHCESLKGGWYKMNRSRFCVGFILFFHPEKSRIFLSVVLCVGADIAGKPFFHSLILARRWNISSFYREKRAQSTLAEVEDTSNSKLCLSSHPPTRIHIKLHQL